MEEKEVKILSKEELKLKAQEMKLEAKQRKAEERAEIRAEKERIRNSFGRKVRNFFLTVIFVIILLVVGFYFAKDYLAKREKELSNEKMGQTYQIALTAIDEKDYEKAIELLKSIGVEYEKFAEVSKKLKEVEQLYLNEYLVDSDKYLKEEKFDKALEVLDQISEEFQSAEIINEKKANIHVAKINAKIKVLEAKKDFIEIIKYLLEYDSNDLVDVKDEIDDLVLKYKNEIILEARELMPKDYKKAKEKIDVIKKIMPDDKDIQELVDELAKFEPVSLVSLTPNQRTGKLTIYTKTKNQAKDIAGNTYADYILSLNSNNSDLNTVEYKLDKKYSKITGKICVLQSSKDATLFGTPVVKFYNGDQVIYTSDEISPTAGNVDFSVDVSEVDKLKIELTGNVNLSYFIADPMLTKK